MRQGMFTLSGALSSTSHFGYYSSVHFGLLHLIHNSYLGSPLSYRTLYIYNACIYSFYLQAVTMCMSGLKLNITKGFNLFLNLHAHVVKNSSLITLICIHIYEKVSFKKK